MKHNKLRQQQGIVALTTVVLSSILFSVVVVSMIGIVANEQHQASEADLSSRAYFAAEGGVEEGVLAVKTKLAACDPTAGISGCAALSGLEGSCLTSALYPPIHSVGPSGSDNTCVLLSHTTNALTGYLHADQSADQVDLSAIPNISKIIISWHIPGTALSTANTTDGYTYTLPTGTGSDFTSQSAWTSPAVLAVQMILFKATSSTFNPNSDLNLLEDVLKPTSATAPAGTTKELDSLLTTNPNTSGGSPDTIPLNATCTPAAPSDSYACTETINIINFASATSYQRILRLRARYASTHYQVQVYTGAAYTLASVPDSYETIDVTAKSGNTYRRVRAKVLIQQNTVGLDYALFSDTDICHDFELRDSKSTAGGTNGFATTNVGSCPF
jgi:hypothetical protein